MTSPVYRLALAERSIGAGLGSVVTGLSDVMDAVGFRRGQSPLRFSEELDSWGEIEFMVPIDHALVTRANFAIGNRELHLYRDEVLVWGGKLWMAGTSGWYVRFKGYGWYYDFTRRAVEDDYASRPNAPKDQFKIVSQLTRYTQGMSGSPWDPIGGSAGRELGIREYEDYHTVESGVTRKLAVCAEERRPISDVIEELSAAKNGFDFAVLADKTLRLWNPSRGSESSVATFDAGDNVSDFNHTEDASVVSTQVAGIGDNEDCTAATVYITDDPDAIAEFGLLHEVTSPEDKRDNQDLVEQTTEAFLDAHKAPQITPSVLLDSQLQPVALVGIAFDDYEMGDVVTVVSSRGATGGFGQFNQDFRVTSREVEVQHDGSERVSAKLGTPLPPETSS